MTQPPRKPARNAERRTPLRLSKSGARARPIRAQHVFLPEANLPGACSNPRPYPSPNGSGAVSNIPAILSETGPGLQSTVSGPMIRMAQADGQRPINLLQQHYSDELMRQSHGPKRYRPGHRSHILAREAVRPADEESQPFAPEVRCFPRSSANSTLVRLAPRSSSAMRKAPSLFAARLSLPPAGAWTRRGRGFRQSRSRSGRKIRAFAPNRPRARDSARPTASRDPLSGARRRR